MGKIFNLINKREIREQASAWLVRLERGLSAQEKAQMSGWLAAQPKHREILLELASLWDALGVLEELAELFPAARHLPGSQSLDTTQPLDTSQPLDTPRSPQPPSSPRPAAAAARKVISWPFGRFYGLSLALTLVAVLVGGWWFVSLAGFETRPESLAGADGSGSLADTWQASSADYATPVGEYQRIKLPDGSFAVLNTNSRMQVAYSDSERHIELIQGEAFFEVARNTQWPFNVRAGDKLVQAVGTAFNVDYSKEDGLEVTVTEGKVKLISVRRDKDPDADPLKEAFISGGQQAIVTPGNEVRLNNLSESQLLTGLAWQQGMVIFEREPLPAALEELGRYTNTRFIIADPALREMLVGGYFRAGDIDTLMVALRDNFQIDSTKDAAGSIILTAR